MDWQYVRQLAIAQLESLKRAGVEQMPRCDRPGPQPESCEAAREASPSGSANSSGGPASSHVSGKSAAGSPDRQSGEPAARAVYDQPAPLFVMPERTLLDNDQVNPVLLSKEERCQALEQLRQKVAACTLCPELVSNRTQTVFGVGHPQPRLCFFGEAPGVDEDLQGEPFVGRAGELLNRMIAACTLRRDDVYILNVLKCRPPNNRAPLPHETENCRPFFEQQLEILHPEFICCLGASAAQALLKTNVPVSRLRGQLHTWRWAKVVVTYHPAYLLRSPQQKFAAWEDLKLLMREMGIPIPDRPAGGARR